MERRIDPTDKSQREEDEEDEQDDEQGFAVATSRDNEPLMLGIILDELDDLAPLCSVSLSDNEDEMSHCQLD